MPLNPSFYVTTVDDDRHEHNYRFLQGETLPEGEELKSQRPAGLVKFRDLLTAREAALLHVYVER